MAALGCKPSGCAIRPRGTPRHPNVWLAFTPPDARAELAFSAHRGPLAVIGTDAPELAAPYLRFAEHALAVGHDACLVPTVDGGYALIALARPTPAAFDLPSEAWGGPTCSRSP
ncbi:MAG: DUF2064 domain-containing protein [Actinomycetota bacterium]|nr:DUF2064 domain-containing protein [Actinomycetota bacterium]